jgi:hypothetical protein
MNTNTPSNMARDAVPAMKKASDDMMNSAGKAMEATRDHANQALDRAESKVRELRGMRQTRPLVMFPSNPCARC